jgi:NADH-quinone oxidoreductase subunit A
MDGSSVHVAATTSATLWPFLVYSLSVVGLLALTLTLAWLLGHRTRRGPATDTPFESGVVPVGRAEHIRISIEFYLIAMFFVIFDLETIFIFGWAIAFYEVGWAGYVGASVFIVFLLVALVYEWRTGALEWGVKHRMRQRDRYSVMEGASMQIVQPEGAEAPR